MKKILAKILLFCLLIGWLLILLPFLLLAGVLIIDGFVKASGFDYAAVIFATVVFFVVSLRIYDWFYNEFIKVIKM